MTHVVGLLGANGTVGGATAKHLAQAAKEGKFKLVLLHRASSPLKAFEGQSHVELKVLDLEGPAAGIEEAVRGINVFMSVNPSYCIKDCCLRVVLIPTYRSAIGVGGLATEPHLIDVLANSPDLVTFFPSTYSSTWDETDKAEPQFLALLNFIQAGRQRAVARGLPVTIVYTGVFDNYFFGYGSVMLLEAPTFKNLN